MEEGVELDVLVIECVIDLLGGYNGRKGQVAARQSFRQADEIRPNTGLLARKQRPSASEPNSDLIRNQMNAVPITSVPQQFEIDRIVHTHSGRTLHQRFHDNSRGLI